MRKRVENVFRENPHQITLKLRVCKDSAGGRSYQNPSIVKLHKLFFELENNHQEDPTHDDATVLDDERSLGHCGNTANDIRDRNLIKDNRFLSEKLVH